MALIGKNVRFEQPSPEKHDQLNLLIDNILRWSAKTGGWWSGNPFCLPNSWNKAKQLKNVQIMFEA